MPRPSISIRSGAGTAARSKGRASAASQARLGAILQTVREGTADTVQTLLADLHQAGDVVPAAEADMIDDIDPEPEAEIDVELDLADEDEIRSDNWGDGPENPEAAAIESGAANGLPADSLILDTGYKIIVDAEACRLHLPEWVGYESRTDKGQMVLEALENRFKVLNHIAQWLSENRKQFLRSAHPWDLGCNALAELKAKHVSVSPRSFLDITGIKVWATPDAFSRYTRDCFLVWPDATAPLSILFGVLARQAWVANVVQQLAASQGRVLTAVEINQLSKIQKPRARRGKQELSFASTESLSFAEALMRATTLADVSLAETLQQYGDQILHKTS